MRTLLKPTTHLCALLATMLMAVCGFSQTQGTYTNQISIQSGTTSLSLKDNFILPFFVKDGKITVKADFGDQYTYGGATPEEGQDFTLEAELKIDFKSSGATLDTKTYGVVLNNKTPEGMVFVSLNRFITSGADPTGFSIDEIALTINSVNATGTGATQAQSDVRFTLSYEVNYGINVSGSSVSLNPTSLLLQPNSDPTRVMHFIWTSSDEHPNYEFQLLRLYNTNTTTSTNEQIITTQVDWSKALSFQTESSAKELFLTIGEGQGYYIWRVRPVGTWFEGNIADSRNWGNWNTSSFSNPNTNYSISTPSNEVFFFTDPDLNKNYQYNRVFTEENKVAETMTYATELNQVRQTQRYFPSKDYKLVSQTVLDRSGRPTLTTIPVPIDGEKMSNYKEEFVTTENGELYKAKHFDLNTNVDNPEKVSTTGDYQYYSNSNTDTRIPNAQGYPFTRTIHESDGTNRVKEQSGVGEDHMIGSQADGRGRTTRTMYSTPSRDELVALFGDEAPHQENVFKVITIDPNNTASVAYISKEGHTIATALTFMETDNTDVFDPLENEPTEPMDVVDIINNNFKSENGFYASKRISFLQETNLSLTYKIKCQVLGGLCTNTEIDCDYQLKVTIKSVDDPTFETVVYTAAVSDATFEDSNCSSCSDSGCEDAYRVLDLGSVTLPAGTYYVQKELVQGEQVTVKVEEAKEKIENQIRPLAGWISSTLEQVDCEEELFLFYNDLFYLANVINSGTISNPITFENCDDADGNELCSGTTHSFSPEFLAIYNEDPSKFSITLYYLDANNELQIIPLPATTEQYVPVTAVIQTPCCTIPLSVLYTPPFKCPTPEELTNFNPYTSSPQVNENFLTEPENTQWMPDFEGYALSMMTECGIAPAEASRLLYMHLQGWHVPGTFNEMVYHMLVDKFSCDGKGENADGESCSEEETDPSQEGTGYDSDCESGSNAMVDGAAYRCADLAACWSNMVFRMLQTYCPAFQGFNLTTHADGSVSDNVDDQDDEIHDETIDEAFDGAGWLVKWLAKRKMSKILRDEQGPGSGGQYDPNSMVNNENHLAYQFLQCTGYRFADILDPDDASYPINSVETRDVPDNTFVAQDGDGNYYAIDEDGNPVLDGEGNIIYYPCFVPLNYDFDGDLSNGEYDPNRYANWPNIRVGPGPEFTTPTTYTLEDLFPNILDPVYAWKYYEYATGTNPNLELETCYRDPNLDFDGNPLCPDEPDQICNWCGKGRITCPYTHESWNCGQRFTYFMLLKSYIEPAFDFDDPINMDCNYYTSTPVYPTPQDPTNEGDVLEIDYISEGIWSEYYASTGITKPDPAEFEGLDGTVSNTVSLAERRAVQMRQQCENTCEARRDEFRAEVIIMFQNRCYIIGGCKLDPNDNIVPEEDIDAIVDEIIAQCQSQCPITTFSCKDEGCRTWNTPVNVIGTNETITNLEYGVGGVIGDCAPEDEADYDPCPPGTTDLNDCSANANHSYSEYTKWLQATSWKLELDVVSKCDETGTFNASVTYTYDENGQPQSPIRYYYNDKGELVLQNSEGYNCEGCDDTFVDREKYFRSSNTALDPNDPIFTDPVRSPKAEIKVEKP